MADVTINDANPTPTRRSNTTAARTRDLDIAVAQTETLALAVAGTTLAGGVFPVMLLICELVLDGRIGINPPNPAAFVAFAILGGFVGGLIALWVSIFVGWGAAVIAALSGITGRTTWFASLVGGWTGFICALWLVTEARLSQEPFIVIGLATVTGQVGAGGMVLAYRRKKTTSIVPNSDPARPRIALRQLFGLTTSIAVIAACLGALQLEAAAYVAIGMAAVLQTAVIGLAMAIGAVRASRRLPAEDVSRETSPPSP